MEIKKATKKDYEKLVFFRYLLMCDNHKTDSRYKISLEKFLRYAGYIKWFLSKKNNAYFIAYEDDLPVGYTHITHNDPKEKNKGYIAELFVLELYRRRGIGKRLIAQGMSYIKKMRLTKAALTTSDKNNDFVKKLYEGLGFSKVRTVGQVVLMEKRIS